jgi:hypothetical protein
MVGDGCSITKVRLVDDVVVVGDVDRLLLVAKVS